METTSSKTPDNSQYSYAYHELREKLINGSNFRELFQEVREKYNSNGEKELVSYDDVIQYLKEDLLPYFESIFNFNLFDTYVNSNTIHEPSICDALRKEYINFIYDKANDIANSLKEFKQGNKEFYKSFMATQNDFTKSIFLFVFKNSHFTGKDTYYVLNGGSNKFIKEYLTSILIQIREQPTAISSRLIQLEINRVHALLLKNANFNFLNWYLDELKSGLNDLKYVYDSQPNYGLKCSEIALKNLYHKLKREDFVDIDHTTETNFVEVFLKNWYSHESICVLKMDNPQTKYFLDQFKIHIDSKLKLSDIEKAKNITNKSGYINSSSLSASSSRNKFLGPKREEDLVALFKKP
ncbi:hypothetical protein FEE95_03140 [Maribacter algarum]|uniref:Uncharacterized protein n=1 Tax=Maribacter algarum (ex Zhang et al. 2020) TaxID=2578118 RepID=A0A5S3PU18_9FLAO|nr:hypothetical protein [Maribacter algarum]TMM58440.1 hypothetical protein FEE95_03140 [Maribacter algarum]